MPETETVSELASRFAELRDAAGVSGARWASFLIQEAQDVLQDTRIREDLVERLKTNPELWEEHARAADTIGEAVADASIRRQEEAAERAAWGDACPFP